MTLYFTIIKGKANWYGGGLQEMKLWRNRVVMVYLLETLPT